VHPEVYRGAQFKILEKKVLILPIVPQNPGKGDNAIIMERLLDGQGFKKHSKNEIGEITTAHDLIVDGGDGDPLRGHGLHFVELVLEKGLEPAIGTHEGFEGIDEFFLEGNCTFCAGKIRRESCGNGAQTLAFNHLDLEHSTKKSVAHSEYG
jgi:hypothetical protein